MVAGVALQKAHERWYPLIEHPVQRKLVEAVHSGIRFPLVPAGRRSGKTERFKRFVSKEAMRLPNEKYFAAAPTRDQAKKIFWDDLKLLTFAFAHPKQPSETELKIFLPNGSEIHVIGLDKPQRIEGINWTGGGIDEVADVKSDSVNENIMPALDTIVPSRPDYRVWCWFLGVPDGLNHYYDMCQDADAGLTPDSKVFHWKSADILAPDVIAAAKKRLSRRQYMQEYEASFETASGRIYEDYGKDNYTDEVIAPHEQLVWMHDQNYTPLSSAIGVVRENSLLLLDEIVLTSAISEQAAKEFVEKYTNHSNKSVIIYGDPAGKQGEKHGHASDYTQIEGVLKANNWKFENKVQRSAPAIKDRQNAVRSKIKTAAGGVSLFVNPEAAVWCHKGLSTVQYLPGSTYQEDQRNDYQHITTAIGYMVDTEWPIDESLIVTPIGMAK